MEWYFNLYTQQLLTVWIRSAQSFQPLEGTQAEGQHEERQTRRLAFLPPINIPAESGKLCQRSSHYFCSYQLLRWQKTILLNKNRVWSDTVLWSKSSRQISLAGLLMLIVLPEYSQLELARASSICRSCMQGSEGQVDGKNQDHFITSTWSNYSLSHYSQTEAILFRTLFKKFRRRKRNSGVIASASTQQLKYKSGWTAQQTIFTAQRQQGE